MVRIKNFHFWKNPFSNSRFFGVRLGVNKKKRGPALFLLVRKPCGVATVEVRGGPLLACSGRPAAPLPPCRALSTRHRPNTPMTDIPSPVVSIDGGHIFLPGGAFSPADLCFSELIGPINKPRSIPKGAKATHHLLQFRAFIPDRPPLAIVQLRIELIELIDGRRDFDFSWTPDRLTVAFAIAQGAVMLQANDIGANTQQSHAELLEPLLSSFLKDCRREIAAKLTGAAEAIGKATNQRSATPEHLFPFDEADPDAEASAFLSLAIPSWRELREVLALPVNLKDLGGGNRSKKSTEEVSRALSAVSFVAYRLRALSLVAKLWGENLEALPVPLYLALTDMLNSECTRLGNRVGQLQGAMKAAHERKGRGNKVTQRPYAAEEVLNRYENLPSKYGQANYYRLQITADGLNAAYPKAPTCTANTVRRLCTEARKARKANKYQQVKS